MKKSSWVLGALAVVLLAATCGWLAIHIVESKTEQAVRDMLAALSASAERVDYSLLNNTLDLDSVACAWEKGGLSATVEHIRVKGFDSACLDASLNGGELPRVADSLVATGVEITGNFLKTHSQKSIAEIRLEGWYQNLGKLAALYRQAGWSEAFFAEAFRYRLEMLAGRDSRSVLTGTAQQPAITTSRAMFGLLGPAGSRDVAAQEGRTVSLFANDVRVEHAFGGSHTERVELHDLRLPSPACASRLAESMIEFLRLNADGDPGDPLEALLDLGDAIGGELGGDYWNSTPYKEIVLRGFTVKSKDAGTRPHEIRLDEIRHQLSLADPLVFGLDLNGVHGSWDAMPEEWQRVGAAFLPDGPLMDGSLHLSLRPKRQPSSVTWSTTVRNLGRAEGSFSLELDTNLVEILNLFENWGANTAADWAAKNVFLKEAEATYSDQGLAALALTMSALYGGTSVEQEWNDIKAALPVLGEDAGELGPMLEEAAATMLDRPGALRVECHPVQPLSFAQLFMALLLDPESVRLVVKAEPGDKNLLDWIPSSLRH